MSSAQLSARKDAVLLYAEDRHRMTRLYEEVLTRVEEMAMITARALGKRPGPIAQVGFGPLAGNQMEWQAVELIRFENGSGCYDYCQGVCFERIGEAEV